MAIWRSKSLLILAALGLASVARAGTPQYVPAASLPLPSGQCVQTDGNGRLTTSGSACGSSSGGGTTGNFHFYISSAATTSTGNDGATLLNLTVNDTTHNPSGFVITSTGTGVPLTVIGNGKSGGALQYELGGTLNVEQKTLGDALVILSSYTDLQQGSSDLLIKDMNVNRNDPIIRVFKSAFNSAPEMRWDSPAPNMEMVATSSDNAHGRGKFEPFATPFQGEILQINSRAWDNTTFENLAYWEPLDIQPSQATPGLFLRVQDLSDDSGVISSSNTSGINFFTQNNHTVGLTGPKNVASGSWRFRLPSTINNQGEILYQADNGDSFNDRTWEFTTGGTSGQCLIFNSGGAPTWGSCTGSGGVGIWNFYSSSATVVGSGADSNPILKMVNNDTVNHPGTIVIVSTGTGVPISVTMNGKGDGAIQDVDGGAVNIKQMTLGDALVIVSSYTDLQQGSADLLIEDVNVARNDPIIRIFKTASNSAPEMRWDSPAPNMEMVATSTDNAHGRGKFEPFATPAGGEILQVNSRAWDNTTFENLAYWEPLSIQPSVNTPGLYLRAQDLANDSGVISSSNTSGINFFTQNGHTIGLTGPKNVAASSWRFRLPSTLNNLGQILYQADNGDSFGDRTWEFTSGGSTGNCLTFNAGAAPTWAACGSSGDALLASTQTFTGSNTFAYTGTSIPLRINNSGNTGISYWNGSFGGDLVVSKQAGSVGDGLVVISSQATMGSIESLLHLVSLTTSYNEIGLWIQSNSTGTLGAQADIRIDANNPDIEFEETDQKVAGTGNGKWEIAVNHDQLQFNQRNAGDSSYQTLAAFGREGALKFYSLNNAGDYVGFISTQSLGGASYTYKLPSNNPNDGDVLRTHAYAGGYYDMYWASALSGGGGITVDSITITGGGGWPVFTTSIDGNDYNLLASSAVPVTVGDIAVFSSTNGAMIDGGPPIAFGATTTSPVMQLTNSGNGNALHVYSKSSSAVAQAVGTDGAVVIDNSGSRSYGLSVVSSTGAAGNAALVYVQVTSPSWTGPVQVIDSSATSSGAVALSLLAPTPQIEFHERNDPMGVTTRWLLEETGDTFRFRSRNTTGSTYQTEAKMGPIPLGGPYVEIASTGSLRLDDLSSHYIALKTSDSISNNMEYVLPNSTGSVGQVLSVAGASGASTGTVNLKWITPTVSTAAGATFPVGAIVNSPSAPSGGGTWLACDGSVVSTSTYASLFAVIGHGYMQYTPTKGVNSLMALGTNVVWTGTQWLYGNGTNGYAYSADGLTWTSGTLPNNATGFTAYAASSTVIAYTTSVNASTSTDSGVTWGAHTLPIAPTDVGRIAPGNTTTKFLMSVDANRNIYTMATGGFTWVTNSNAIPANPTVRALWWTGSGWQLHDNNGISLDSTTVASGASGWGSVTPSPNLSMGAATSIVNGTTVINHYNDIVMYSTDGGVTYTGNPQVTPIVKAMTGGFWNGFCYVFVIKSTTAGGYVWTSADGKQWHNSGALNLGSLFTSNGNGGAAGFTVVSSNTNADPATGKFILFAGSQPYLMTPTANLSTQFTLPNIPGAYIEAL